jgi:hypothetical protein
MLRTKVLILGSLIFFTHSAYAQVVTQHVINQNNSIECENTSVKIASILENRGLDKDIAIKKVNALYKQNTKSIELSVHNIKMVFPTISQADIENELSNAALFSKTINFNSYDDMIGLVQKIAIKKGFSYKPDDVQKLISING